VKETVRSKKVIALSNGQYVKETAEKKAHIRANQGCTFDVKRIERSVPSTSHKAVVDENTNKSRLERIKELFTKEQIEQINTGLKNKVNVKIYANPKLSAEQMKILREALELGLQAQLFADPEYSVDSMRTYKADLKYGVDISHYLNPKYNAEQLSELSIGVDEGLNVSAYADPDIDANEMAEIRLRLETNMWDKL